MILHGFISFTSHNTTEVGTINILIFTDEKTNKNLSLSTTQVVKDLT